MAPPPDTDEKKPFWKKTWFIATMVVAGLLIVGLVGFSIYMRKKKAAALTDSSDAQPGDGHVVNVVGGAAPAPQSTLAMVNAQQIADLKTSRNASRIHDLEEARQQAQMDSQAKKIETLTEDMKDINESVRLLAGVLKAPARIH